MKLKFISLLLASSMLTGNFAAPVTQSAVEKQGTAVMLQQDEEEDLLTDGSDIYAAVEAGYDNNSEAPNGITEAPESTNEAPYGTTEATYSITETSAPESATEAPYDTTETPEAPYGITETSETATEIQESITEAPYGITETSETISESSEGIDEAMEEDGEYNPPSDSRDGSETQEGMDDSPYSIEETPVEDGENDIQEPESSEAFSEGLESIQEENGGYEFSGYLEDGIPNYVWIGDGTPSMLGSEYTLPEAEEAYPDYSSTPDTETDSNDTAATDEEAYPDYASAQDTEIYSNDTSDTAASDKAEETEYDTKNGDPVRINDEKEYSSVILAASVMPASKGRFLRTLLMDSLPFSENDELSSSLPEEEEKDIASTDTDYTGDAFPANEDYEGSEDISDSSGLLSDAVEESVLKASAVRGYSTNYIADTEKREVYQGFKHMSSNTDHSMADGLHTMPNGKVRGYKDGKYFIGGGFALDGVIYYSDENGDLIGGWLKTIIDSSTPDIRKVKNDMAFAFRYFDPSTFEMQKGRIKIDGLWHYFNDKGGMLTNKSVNINGNYYFCDRYGICEQVKLRFGNTIISENNQNNDRYLAKNMVNAVDINTFNGQNGEYSFRPKWNSDITTLELFGFLPTENASGFYFPIRDNSLKGKIGCIYRNVGKYMGRQIDMRLTITDYEFFDLNGETETGYFYVFKNRIGLNATNTRSITADMQFLDHLTGTPVSLKGYATFSDIDIGQSITVLSPVDEVYVDKNCVLYKDPDSLAFSAPFEADRVGDRVNNSVRENWVQVNYSGSRLSFRFGSAYEQFRFAESGRLIAGEARDIWNKSYSGDPSDYSIWKDGGLLYQSWQGLYYKRLGRVSIPPVSKLVSDSDEKEVTENRLTEDETSYYYTLVHNVPSETAEYFYSSYLMTDELEEGLDIQRDKIVVRDDNGTDVTDRFNITVTGQKVEFSANADILQQETFYDNNYSYFIPVTIPDIDLLTHQDGEDYVIHNQCLAFFNRSSGPEESKSNDTVTRIKMKEVFGTITITKKILEKDIIWAHGNPTFLFSAQGNDSKNNYHRYEEYVCFSNGNYTVDSSGYAQLSVTISHVPAGVYKVCELPVIDYYLTKAEAQTANMEITRMSEPGRGKNPASVTFGIGTITKNEPDTGITFTDEKGDYHGYRHNDIVKNNIPVAFDTET